MGLLSRTNESKHIKHIRMSLALIKHLKNISSYSKNKDDDIFSAIFFFEQRPFATWAKFYYQYILENTHISDHIHEYHKGLHFLNSPNKAAW